jgi:hypothetical protein
LSDNTDNNKALIFVSPGRCGTTRIAQILREKLPEEEFAVTHQMAFSRLANVLGNLMYYFGQSEKIKAKLYNFIVSRYINGGHFITTDPLTAMIIPKKWVESKNVCIVQITRDPKEFAESFYRFSRKKKKSLIAHNLVPFWQPDIIPLENLLGRRTKVKNKYKHVALSKEIYFDSFYALNPNYTKINISFLFSGKFLERIIELFFGQTIKLMNEDISRKANET